jgi:hypothetical protein
MQLSISDWSRWFAISSSHVYAYSLIVEVAKKQLYLDILILFLQSDVLSTCGDPLSHLTDWIHHSGPHFGRNLATQPNEPEPVTTCTAGWPT